MADRARLSKLPTNGPSFLGSASFPPALVSACLKFDPKGQLFGVADSPVESPPSEQEQARLRPLLDATIKGKSVLVCSGGVDKLVPYRCSEGFLRFLKGAAGSEAGAADEDGSGSGSGSGGWYRDGGVYVEDNVYAGIGHATSPEMVKDSTRFLCDLLLKGKDSSSGGGSRDKAKTSKM